MDSGQSYSDRRLMLAREWDSLVAEIRAIEGFESFLLPPQIGELMAAGDEGPVFVVNASRWRCDALVVADGALDSVRLPHLTHEDVAVHVERHLAGLAEHRLVLERLGRVRSEFARTLSHAAAREVSDAAESARRVRRQVNADLSSTLGWLWDVVVAPLEDRLSSASGRVWWCVTGGLGLLPMHAAGSEERGWLMDRVVSSYAPTLRALIDARRRTLGETSGRGMGVISTLGDVESLVGADGPLRDVVDRSLVVTDSSTTVTSALHVLEHCSSVHFDCHATQNLAAPGEGGFILGNGRLRVFDLARATGPRDFAGLAACDSAASGSELSNESITLATALHYAGFRHVVGALWELRDDVARRAFDSIYRDIAGTNGLELESVAESLARVVRDLRDECPQDPYTWASLIHLGP